uniref:Putative rhs-related protein n=1 Tax=Ralstonia solanacearum TaxID=305 RepID=A0A0S4TY25_RALSL
MRDSVQPSYDANGYITDWKYIVASTGMIERYDASGKLVRVEERNGRSTVLAYNSKNLLSQVKATSGRSLTFAYDSQGRIARVTAPDGAITGYAYNTAGMLSKVTWPDNATRQYVYEDTRFPTALTGVIDEAGVRYATYAYDDQGRAITSELTAGADRYQFQYQTNGQTTVLTPDGGSSVYSFLKQNGVLLSTGVSGSCPLCGSTAQSTSYDTNGNATRKVGYDGSVTTYAYDSLGRQVLRIDSAETANATTTTTEWHPSWNLPVRAASPGKLGND